MKTLRAFALCLSSIAILVLPGDPVLAAETLPDAVVPVAGTTAGAAGANFRTEAQLHNPSDSEMTGRLVFVWQGIPIQPNPVAELDYQLAPRQTLVYEDLVAEMGGNGLGSIDLFALTGGVPELIVRAFDDKGENGTTGLMVPVLGVDRTLTKGGRASLVVPADLQRYRFNIGIRTLFSEDPSATLRIVVRDGAGQQVGDVLTKDFPNYFFAQAAGEDFLGQPLVAGSSISFEAMSGRVILYSTTTDNTTNDGSIQIDRVLNLPPVVDPAGAEVTTSPATPVTIPFLATDPDDDPIEVTVDGEPAHGTVTIAIAEAGISLDVTYTPEAGFEGGDGFAMLFDDGNGGTTSVVVNVTVGDGNSPPIALGNSYTLIQGTTLDVAAPGVLSNDSDADGDTLTAVVESPPSKAAAFNLSADGSLTYTPLAGFAGADLFTYRADDGQATSNVATVRIQVESSNTAPTAAADAAATDEDTPVMIAVLANDSDVETPGQLTLVGVTTTGTLGTATIVGTEVNYDPTASPTLQALATGASTTDTFQYTVRDPEGLTATTTVTVTVNGVDDLPAAANDTATVNEDATATAIDVLANDVDPDGGPVTIGSVTQGSSGTVVITGGGTGLTYQPSADYCGTDSFTYTLNGGSIGTVNVTVNCVNDAPSFTKGADQTVLEDAGAQTVSGWATAISVGPANEATQTASFGLTNDNNSLFSVQPAIDAATGNLTYTPAPDANGTANVTVNLSDDGGTANGGVDSAAAQAFVINVTAVNDAPSFTKGADQTVLEDAGAQTVSGWATALSRGPSDESGQTLSFNAGNDNNALFSVQPALDSSGNLIYTPAANASGSATVTVSIMDDGGTANGGVDTSASQTFTINVTDINDVPSFTKGVDQTVLEDAGAQTVAGWATAISAGPASEAGQTLTFNVTGNTNAALFSAGPAISSAGDLTYTPAANANGTATITITLSDNGGTANGGVDTSVSQSFIVNVTAVNDPPSFTKGADQSVNENAGAQTVNGWATAIGAGPADESFQTLAFNVTANDNTALFSAGPAISAAGVLTYTPAANANGTANITIALQDNGGTANGGVDTSATQSFIISVVSINSAPSFIKGADQTVLEDAGAQTASGWATAISPGAGEAGQVLTFNVTGNTNTALFSAGPAIDPTTGDLTYTPAANANGTATITITLSDDGGTANGGVDTSPAQSFVINVTAVNDVPSFTKGADQTVLEDAGAQTVNGWAPAISAGPADESAQTLTFNVTGNTNAALFSVAPAISSAGVLTYTPAANANGSSTITVTLQDNGGTTNGGVDTSVSQSFVINVTAVNDVPSFTKGADQNVNDDAGAVTVNPWATAVSAGPANESGQALTFNITGNTNSAIFAAGPAISSTGVLTYTPATVTGTVSSTITITLSDNGGTANGGVDTTASQSFTVSVTHVNTPPTIIASPKESFDTIGNTAFELKAAQALSPSVFVSGNLVSNFTDSDGPSALSMSGIVGCADVSSPYDNCATTNGGVVSATSSGEFTFTPKEGDTNASDTFQYTVTDGASPVTRTVTINRQGRVWYVKNDATAGGLGRSSDPFDTLAEAETASIAGDTIYVYSGSGTNTGQNAGITLKANQRLLGSGVALTVPVSVNGGANPTTLLAAGTQPVIGNGTANSDGVAVTDVSGVEIRGLNITGTQNAIDVTTTATSGGATITSNTIGGAGAEGIRVAAGGSGAMALVITDNTWAGGGTHTGNAVSISRTAGTMTLDFSRNTNILSSAATAVFISGGAAASSTVTGFADNTVSGDTATAGIQVTSVTFDATPGGNFDVVSGGTTAVGASGNRVGTYGIGLGNVSGHLSFTDLDVFTASGAGLDITGTGALTATTGTQVTVQNASTSVIDAVGGPAVLASNTTLNTVFSTVTSTNSGTTGVSLTTVGGTFTAGAGSAISNAAGTDFNISGGTANVTYGGTINDATGTVVAVANATGGTKAFGGAITSGAVSLTNNTGATINFTGGLTLSTGGSAAFTATGGGPAATSGGTVNVTGTNTITTTTGTALNVANTTIGASGLTFRSVSSNGAANGIVLNNTGTLGGLTVTGTGGAGSGGTIQNSTGAGVSLTTTRGISFTSMNIQNGGSDGIAGSGVTNFTLANSTVSANGNAVGERGIEFTNLLGSASITGSTITGSAEDNLYVLNDSGTLTLLTLSNSTLSNNSATFGNDGILFVGNGNATMSISVSNCTFTNHRGDHFQAATDTASTAVMNVTFQSNDLNGVAGNLGAGLTLSPSGNATLNFDILNNGTVGDPFTGAVSSAITINSSGNATMSGTISGNVIGNPSVTDSGSSQGDGITVFANNTSDVVVAITNNTIREYSNLAGINVHVRDGASGTIQATITGNSISDPGTFASNGILAQAGSVAGDAGFLCIDIGGAGALANSIAGSGANGGEDFRVRQRISTSVRLPGYAGANNDNAAVVAFIQGRNTGAETGSATNNVAGGGGGFVGGAACTAP